MALYGMVAAGAGILVAPRFGSTTYRTSPDGITWTNRTLAFTAAFSTPRSILFGLSKFFLCEEGAGKIYSSANGTTWALCYTAAETVNFAFVMSGRVLFAINQEKGIFLSTLDGATWTRRQANASGMTGTNANTSTHSVFRCANGSIMHVLSARTEGYISRPLAPTV